LNFSKSSGKRTIVLISTVAIIVLYHLFHNDILLYFNKIALNHGYSVRLLTSLANKALFEDEGRDLLIKHSVHLIIDNPIFGVGIYHDRILLATLMGAPLSEATGWYPHNLIIELLLQFGLILGGVMIVCFFLTIYRAVLKSRNNDYLDILLSFIGFAFLPLLFSESYLRSGLFFILLGLSINVLRDESISNQIY
jgi:O-antigen ligase